MKRNNTAKASFVSDPSRTAKRKHAPRGTRRTVDRIPLMLPPGEVVVSAAAMAAVAFFKGIPVKAIAAAACAPASAVSQYLDGTTPKIKMQLKSAIAEFLGIDLMTGRLKRGVVHFFHLGYMGRWSSEAEFRAKLGAMGALLRESKAARLHFPTVGLLRRGDYKDIHVVQNDNIRAVFVGGSPVRYRARFRLDSIPRCRWVLNTEEESVVEVSQSPIAKRIKAADLTTLEFDEIFLEDKALTWEDVDASARVNLVSKGQIIDWVETVGANRHAINKKVAMRETASATRADTVVPAHQKVAM